MAGGVQRSCRQCWLGAELLWARHREVDEDEAAEKLDAGAGVSGFVVWQRKARQVYRSAFMACYSLGLTLGS